MESTHKSKWKVFTSQTLSPEYPLESIHKSKIEKTREKNLSYEFDLYY
jgi:hypothetical protein